MNYNTIKEKHEKLYNSIMSENKVFWAFSKEQLEEGKKKIGIKDNKDLTSIGMGGFMPKTNADKMFKALSAEDKRYKKELREAKEAKKQAILYELKNHECFYTGDISDVVDKFKGIFTKKDIQKVYKTTYQSNV